MFISAVKSCCRVGTRLTSSTIVSGRAASSRSNFDLDRTDEDIEAGLDQQQVKLLNEPCLLVDENDRQIGTASKRHCHRWTEGAGCPLHRAFSVFLFNSRDELLLQQRSHAKITFPGHYTNTCCSHPLATADEQITHNGLGVINAARRRLHLELGIDPEQVPVSKFTYLTRIMYSCRSENPAGSAAVWGEHEIDYILVLRGLDVEVRPNLNEVSHCQFVSQHALAGLLDKLRVDKVPLTPWFSRVLANSRLLPAWWTNLDRLETMVDHEHIHKL